MSKSIFTAALIAASLIAASAAFAGSAHSTLSVGATVIVPPITAKANVDSIVDARASTTSQDSMGHLNVTVPVSASARVDVAGPVDTRGSVNTPDSLNLNVIVPETAKVTAMAGHD